MELKFASKIACGPRHWAVRQQDFSQTYCDAAQMVPLANRYRHEFLLEPISQYSPPPPYVSTRSRADIQLEQQRKAYAGDRSSPQARELSYRQLHSRLAEVKQGIGFYRSYSPPLQRLHRGMPRWTHDEWAVESEWAGGDRLERRV